jgi:tetratricopeptide (TPR) repeat protein
MSICQEGNLLIFFPRMAAALGSAYTLAGRFADAISLLTQAMGQTTAVEMVGFQALWRLPLGEAHLLAGCLEEAQRLAEQALAHAREYREQSNEAYAWRLLGTIATRREPLHVEQATAHYHQALTLAEALDMRPLQAHCHHGLGRLYYQNSRAEQAHATLATAIDFYRAMDMTFWLPEAEAALAQMI